MKAKRGPAELIGVRAFAPGQRGHAPEPQRVSDMAYENRRLAPEIALDRQAEPQAFLGTGLGSTNDNDALGRTEWSVIDMARAEGPRSANPNALINRLLRKLFGIAIARPLANERLESLRRFALAAWFRPEISLRDMRRLFAAGFSSNDAARIIAYVGVHRGSVPEVEAWP